MVGTATSTHHVRLPGGTTVRDPEIDAGEGALLASLFSAAPRRWYVLDGDLRLAYLNRAAAADRDLPGEEALGRRLTDLAPGFPARELSTLAGEVLETGATMTG